MLKELVFFFHSGARVVFQGGRLVRALHGMIGCLEQSNRNELVLRTLDNERAWRCMGYTYAVRVVNNWPGVKGKSPG